MSTIEKLVQDYPLLLSGNHKETEASLQSVESALGVRLPRDVRWLLLEHGHGIVNAVSNIQESVEHTRRFRTNAGLPYRYVVLDEMGDAGVVLLDTEANAVVWADWRVVGNLDGDPPAQTMERFETFTAWVESRIADLADDQFSVSGTSET